MASLTKRVYQKFQQVDHIKHRPDTYVGSIKSQTLNNQYIANLKADKPILQQKKTIRIKPALVRVFVEILSNALDNIARSIEDGIAMTKIEISIDEETGEITIWNDGSWIPISTHKETGISIPQLIFGELLTSSNYDDSQERSVSGRNGYGAKLTNIFSTKFDIEIVCPDGENWKVYRQSWSNNMKDKTDPEVVIRDFGPPSTKITWIPDFKFFKCKGYTNDLLGLYHKFVYDAAMISGDHRVSVYLNKKKLPINGLRSYAKMFNDCGEILEIKTSDSVVVIIPSSAFEFSAFTNGVYNDDGGVHVEMWGEAIFRPLLAKFNKKNKPHINIKDIRQFFHLFIKCNLPNPEFSSQSKTFLTSPQPTIRVTNKHILTLSKWSFAEKVREIIQAKELISLKKTEKKRKGFQKIPGYDPANNSGGRLAKECILIFTEGLSAKTFAVRGISKGFNGKSGRDWFGIFPLRGKLLNCSNAKVNSIIKNIAIKNAINALGLRFGVDYTVERNFLQLNYGKIAMLCDADVDGIHIQGLFINFLICLFPSLFERSESFIVSMETPLVRVFDGRTSRVFYDERRFESFMKEDTRNKSLRKKYHKGLGTSSNSEVLKTFGERIIEYIYDKDAKHHFTMLFNSKLSDSRKKWLSNYDPDNVKFPDAGSNVKMDLSDFVNHRMICYSLDDCGRSIPHLLDGLKESQRKILYAVFKKKLDFGGKTLKIAQLAGYVAETTAYHHGEQCLFDTIIKLANDIVGMNNIPLFFRDGQFGTRLSGGKDASAARYIFTKLDKLTRHLFPKIDDNLLPRRTDDGNLIEPRFYIPIIPMILVNGCQAGIGTGWSCSVPLYNPMDLVTACRNWMTCGIDKTPSMRPWYRNFSGKITKINKNKFRTIGVLTRERNKVKILELPIGLWTDKFKEFLEDLLEKKMIKSLKNYSTPQKVLFEITEHPNGIKCNIENLKLSTIVTTTNMVLFLPNGKLKKFDTPMEIISYFCAFRLKLYEKRRSYLIKECKSKLEIAEQRYRFLDYVMKDKIVVYRKNKPYIIQELETHGFQKFKTNKDVENFDYLLNMDILSFSEEKLERLTKEIAKYKTELESFASLSAKDMWVDDLQNFESAYNRWTG